MTRIGLMHENNYINYQYFQESGNKEILKSAQYSCQITENWKYLSLLYLDNTTNKNLDVDEQGVSKGN